MSVTLNDLAKMCGVSKTTVIRALHGEGRINDKTKSMIINKAKEMDYQPNLLARSLVSGKTMTLGIVIPDLRNQYFPKIVDAVAKTVNKQGYILNIMVHEDNKESERRIIRNFAGHGIDGIIINPINKGNDFTCMMNEVKVPYVVLSTGDCDNCNCVGIDERKAGRDAAEYIIEKGYKDIVFVAPTLYDSEHVFNIGHHNRMDGILDVVKSSADIHYELISSKQYTKEAAKYMKKNTHPAFLCSGALFTSEVMASLREAGYKTVKDFGIMSFDQMDFDKNWSPRLTAIDNHPEKIGEVAGKTIIQLSEGEKVRQRIYIPYQIVEGDSL